MMSFNIIFSEPSHTKYQQKTNKNLNDFFKGSIPSKLLVSVLLLKNYILTEVSVYGL